MAVAAVQQLLWVIPCLQTKHALHIFILFVVKIYVWAFFSCSKLIPVSALLPVAIFFAWAILFLKSRDFLKQKKSLTYLIIIKNMFEIIILNLDFGLEFYYCGTFY